MRSDCFELVKIADTEARDGADELGLVKWPFALEPLVSEKYLHEPKEQSPLYSVLHTIMHLQWVETLPDSTFLRGKLCCLDRALTHETRCIAAVSEGDLRRAWPVSTEKQWNHGNALALVLRCLFLLPYDWVGRKAGFQLVGLYLIILISIGLSSAYALYKVCPSTVSVRWILVY